MNSKLKLYNRIMSRVSRQVKNIINESLANKISNISSDNIETSIVDKTMFPFVDLGLPSGTWWAKCNLGANKPEEFGLYYQLGSIEGHEPKTFDFKYSDYFKHYDYDYYGLSELRKDDDAAYVLSNGLARIPTKEQCQELIDNCEYEWTKLHGVIGALFTGPNGNSIFIPAAGYCSGKSVRNIGSNVYIWSLTLYSANTFYTYSIYCNSVGATPNENNRYDGFSVRAIYNK